MAPKTAAASWRPNGILRCIIIPLFFMATLPATTVLLWIIVAHFDGSILRFVTEASVDRVVGLWPWPSAKSAAILATWVAVQTFLLLALPCGRRVGSTTPEDDAVFYRLNGVLAFFTTVVCFCLGGYLGAFSPTVVYDQFGEILMTSNLAAIAGSVVLYLKGLWAPSTRDSGTSGRLIWDFYWGVELHPRLFGIDLKQLVICRIAMMGWAVILLSCAAKQIVEYGRLSNAMAISVGLQLVYIFKFFCWEDGYFNTLDIMHYRLGYRNFWGVMAWLPAVYPLASLFLVDHPNNMPLDAAAAITLLGLTAIWANYDADAQRQRVRLKAGNTTVWGRTPQVVRASYTTPGGAQQEALLLMSGWWGVARHFHYVPEVVLAVSWTLPAGLNYLLPWFYIVYLLMLLVHRAAYDDHRCLEKYGKAWSTYCARVPYRMIPYVY